MEEQGIHVWVSGKVQGVYFRETLRKVAIKLGVRGWVRNLDDGRVELKAFAVASRLASVLDFCRQGPVLARVDHLEVEPISVETVKDFQVLREG